MRLAISETFTRFFETESSGGLILIVCTLTSLALANSALGADYLAFWHLPVAGLRLEHWVNDGLMALFFLLVGLELEREVYVGELSDFRSALLPAFAALGGIVAPALIHYSLNVGTPTQPGAGIPMATDIVFALGVLALLGNRVPTSLKIFLTALAVMDDLGAILIIAFFYTAKVSFVYLGLSLAVFGLLLLLNRVWRVMMLAPYLIGGVVMWFLMLKSGVHATVSGVLLAFAIPFSAVAEDVRSPSHRLEHFLHKPVAFLILPVFALVNTGLLIGPHWQDSLFSANSLGIFAGLVLGKPMGVLAFCSVAVLLGVCRLPASLKWRHIVGAGALAGVGFTMSIFITNLAFVGQADVVNASKLAIFLASLCAGALGFCWLRLTATPHNQTVT